MFESVPHNLALVIECDPVRRAQLSCAVLTYHRLGIYETATAQEAARMIESRDIAWTHIYCGRISDPEWLFELLKALEKVSDGYDSLVIAAMPSRAERAAQLVGYCNANFDLNEELARREAEVWSKMEKVHKVTIEVLTRMPRGRTESFCLRRRY